MQNRQTHRTQKSKFGRLRNPFRWRSFGFTNSMMLVTHMVCRAVNLLFVHFFAGLRLACSTYVEGRSMHALSSNLSTFWLYSTAKHIQFLYEKTSHMWAYSWALSFKTECDRPVRISNFQLEKMQFAIFPSKSIFLHVARLFLLEMHF